MTSKYVAIKAHGTLEIHLPGVSGVADFDTFCGLNVDENPGVDHHLVEMPPGAKVDCKECRIIWEFAMEFTIRDFGG